jgi:hypothetical protein
MLESHHHGISQKSPAAAAVDPSSRRDPPVMAWTLRVGVILAISEVTWGLPSGKLT